jgi:anti-sigma factor RsiW
VSVRLLSRDLVCEEAVRLVTDYLEGTLSRRQRRRFERHLRGCPNCSAYLEQIRATIAIAGRVDSDSLPGGTREELIELYRRYREE